jgi:hypothetical protein
MDAIREWLKNPKIALLLGLVAGLLVGLIFGWGIWPVKWKDAAPQQLHLGYQRVYLQMAIDSYKVNPDVPTALARWRDLGPNAQKLLDEIKSSPGQDLDAIQKFASAVGAAGAVQTPVAGGTPAPTSPAAPAARPTTTSLLLIGVVVMCLITLLVGAALFYFLFMRGGRRGGVLTPAQQAQQAAREAQPTDYAALGEEAPMAQYMASYKLGDDLFDSSFSIDSPSGEFMGECGVGISETIGVGDPKKVTAFEVWLFDKNDIQTVTKVLMSTHTFNDEATRQRMAAKGEPVPAQIGQQVVLETQTLQLVARVVEMTYGEGALPAESFFDQFMLELAVWAKRSE